jgi:predicted secreted protein
MEKVGVTTGKFIAGLIIAILVSCAVSAAVCPCARATTMWSKTYGGVGDDKGWGDLVQTSDGGYAISGDTASFGAGSSDYWLIKIDSAGNMLWNKTYGGSLAESENAMVQTIDGGYALGGVTSSFGAGGQDFWLVKTDAAGNMQWNKTYGGTGADVGINVFQTSDGGYAIAGLTSSFGAGGMDVWLVKTDAAGNMQWNQTYGGPLDEWMDQMIRTVDGGYAIAGYTSSFGAGGQDVWLVKTDAAGNMQWNKTYGGTGNDHGFHIMQTVDGGYAIIGSTDSFGAGGQDVWLVKTDAAGNMQWNQTYGGTGAEFGYSLVATSDGGYAIAGYTDSFGAGSYDFWLIKTDGLGVIPEGLTIGAMMLMSTVAVIVSLRYFRKRPKTENFSQVKL